MKYLMDTNTISAILKGDTIVKNRLQNVILGGNTVLISAICYYEVKRGLLDAKATAQLAKFNRLCRKLGVLLLDTLQVFETAARIYVSLKQSGRLLEGDADILIASSALEHNLIVVTDNTRHFNRIPNIKTENWLC